MSGSVLLSPEPEVSNRQTPLENHTTVLVGIEFCA